MPPTRTDQLPDVTLLEAQRRRGTGIEILDGDVHPGRCNTLLENRFRGATPCCENRRAPQGRARPADVSVGAARPTAARLRVLRRSGFASRFETTNRWSCCRERLSTDKPGRPRRGARRQMTSKVPPVPKLRHSSTSQSTTSENPVHSGQADCVMMLTKSSRLKCGSKCARTSSFIVPNVVSGRSFMPS